MAKCTECDGRGYQERPRVDRDADGTVTTTMIKMRCPWCNGTGRERSLAEQLREVEERRREGFCTSD